MNVLRNCKDWRLQVGIKFKYWIVGLLMGMVIGGGIAWAAGSLIWVDDSGKALGTTANPVYITTP